MEEIKILGIGDAHGEDFPNIKNIVKKEKIDFIICTGDLPEADEIRNIIFNNFILIHLFGFGIHHFMGIKKYKKMVKKAEKSQEKIIKRLGSVDKKVFLVYGNNDYMKSDVRGFKQFKLEVEPLEEKIKNKKNIILLKRKSVRFNEFTIVGHSGAHTYHDPSKYKKQKKMLGSMLNKSPPEKTIFLTHEPPHGFLDKVKMKSSPFYGEKIGNPLYLELIKKYQPLVQICGHIHEGFGTAKVGKTEVINLGALTEKHYMVISIKEDKVTTEIRKI